MMYLVDAQENHRLLVLNKLYNPNTLSFLMKSGLIAGMTVLVIGCGSGYVSCEIAKIVGPHGTVIATDISADSLKYAALEAKRTNVNNITFELLDLNEGFSKFNGRVDFIFGRWVIEFTQNPQKVFKSLFKLLKKGGIIAYESSDFNDLACFSYPDDNVISHYKKIMKKLFVARKMPRDFIKRSVNLLTTLGAQEILVATDQALLLTAEDKALFRLGIVAERDFLLNEGILSVLEFNKITTDCEDFEKRADISGFNRTFSVSAKHP